MTAFAALRIRLIVLLGALAILAAGAAAVLLARAKHETTAPPQQVVTTAHNPVTHPRTAHPARPAPVHAAAKVPRLVPLVLHRALERRAVVVVSVVVGSGAAEAASVSEARAAASSAGSGFLRVDVSRRGNARAFAKILGADTMTPATLIVKRPGSVFVRLDGYNDRAVVAQAVGNARSRS